MPYANSASEEVEGELIALIERLGSLKAAARKARSPTEIDAAVAQMRVTINRGMRVGHTWAKEDLKKVFNDEYRLHWTQTKPKRDIDAAFNLRKKSRQSMNRLETGLNKWADEQGRNILVGKQLGALETAMRGAKGEDFIKLRQQAQGLRKQIVTDTDIPPITYFSKRGKHASVAEMPAPTYVRMALRAGHVDNENQGFIRGARQAGIEELSVRDGDECGWVTHDSSPLADGMSVTPTEAMAHPKAHPNCVRYFVLPSAAERKAARERARVRAAAQKEARKLRKAQLVKAAKVTAKAAAVGVKLYRSPATQILINNIVSERYALPEPLKEFVAKFARYEAQEKAVATSASLAEKQEVTPDEVRQRILEWSDSVIGAEDAVHKVPVAMQKVLGLQPEASTGRITDAAWSYGDWVAKNRGQTAGVVDNLVDSGVWAEARSELHHDTPVLASFFHMANPRGFNVGGATGQTIHVIRDAFSKDADKITEEAIREIAGLIDPFPWAKGKFGPVKMSVGMSTEGRRDLAAKLFKQIRDTRRWSDVDRDVAKQLGVNLVEPVTLKDVHKALLPRLTLNPGGLFSFTVASENGFIRPVFRVLPQWAITKYMGAEFTMSTGAPGRIKEAIDQGANLVDVLRGLPDEIITHLNFMRNGPFNANLAFWGKRFNGYATYLFKDNDWFRLANRYRRYERMSYQGWSKDDLVAFAEERGVSLADGLTNAQMGQRLLHELGPIVRMDRMWSEISVMPTGWSTITFTGKNGEFDVIANLHRWSGSLVHVAREMRIDYLSLKYWYAEAQKKMNYQYERLHGAQLQQVRSYEDLKTWADSFKDPSKALMDIEIPKGVTVGRHNVSPILEHEAGDKLLRDIDRFNYAWDQIFPHLPRPHLDIYTPGSPDFEEKTANLFYRADEQTIYIRNDLSAQWGDFAHIRKRNTFIGFWPKGTEDPVAGIWHESGHHLFLNLTPEGLTHMVQTIADENLFPKFVRSRMVVENIPVHLMQSGRASLRADLFEKLQQIFLGSKGMRAWVAKNLSGYATRNIHELIAEAFTEYATAKHPRPLAMILGRTLAVYGMVP